MSLDSRLEAWVEAGLIDLAAADRIRAHEALTQRPTALWAMVGLGLLALLLGIALLISANWDRIADWLKLGVHMALLAGAAAAHWWARRSGRDRVAEGALFLFAGLVLAGLALQSQLFQLTGPIWHMLLLWLALAGPALLLAGATRLTGLQFASMALVGPAIMAIDQVSTGGWWLLAQGAAMAVPALLLLLSLLPAGNGPGFRLALREAGLVGLLAGASIAHFAWASQITSAQAADNAIRLLLPLAASALALLVAGSGRGDFPRPLLLPILLAPLVAVALALALPHADHTASRLAGVVAFIGMWALAARGAVASGWTSLFAVAIAAIGIRIFIIYLELFGSLAATGGGLIVGGVLLVGLAWLWQRIVRQKAAA